MQLTAENDELTRLWRSLETRLAAGLVETPRSGMPANGHRPASAPAVVKSGATPTDFKRWWTNSRQDPAWDGRNQLIAAMIRPGATVLDVGAGAMTLRHYLAPGCDYTPLDVVKTSDQTVLVDFNAYQIPSLPRVYDVAVCGGVMEYVLPVDWFLATIARLARSVILTYAVRDAQPDAAARQRNGWLNHFTDAELRQLFQRHGLKLTRELTWERQRIYVLDARAAGQGFYAAGPDQPPRPDLISLFRYDPTNVGDFYCAPFRYLDLGSLRCQDILQLREVSRLPGQLVIGGGGLLGSPTFDPCFEQLFQRPYQRVIGWGLGDNARIDTARGFIEPQELAYPDYVKRFHLLGVRDFGAPYPWVPCASCLHPLFHVSWPRTHEVVVFEHKRVPIPIEEFPKLTNDTNDLALVLRFLGSARVVITNSYHGAYWSQLLGKGVLVFPFSTKFYHLKHKATLCKPSEWKKFLDRVEEQPPALAECVRANLEFWSRARQLLSPPQEASSPQPNGSSTPALPALPTDCGAASPSESPVLHDHSGALGEPHRARLLSFLKPGGRMLVWGGRQAIPWLAERLPEGATLVAVEHEKQALTSLAATLKSHPRVRCLYRELPDSLAGAQPFPGELTGPLLAYARPESGASYDVLVVDGLARPACLQQALQLLTSQGVVFLHDAQEPGCDLLKQSFVEYGVLGPCQGDPGPHLWWGGLSLIPVRPWIKGPNSTPLIISFYTTNTGYEEEAKRLLASCQALQLDHYIEPVSSRGSWELNCAYKAGFILKVWEQSRRPVLWVDADAVVRKKPELLNDAWFDFAIHKVDRWELASGTLFFNQTPGAGRLLRRWLERCRQQPLAWDQISLDQAWEDITATQPLETLWLPDVYTKIFDRASRFPGDEIVVEHFQASRRFKKQLSLQPTPPPAPDPQLCQARKASRPRQPLATERALLPVAAAQDNAPATLGQLMLQLALVAQLQDPDRARSLLWNAVLLLPQFKPAWLALGSLYFQQSNLEMTVAVLHQARDQLPTDVEISAAICRALLAAARLPEADAEVRRGLSLQPDYPPLLRLLDQLGQPSRSETMSACA